MGKSRRKPPDALEQEWPEQLKRKRAEILAEKIRAGAVLIIRVFFGENIMPID
jgi:hypothetical protein